MRFRPLPALAVEGVSGNTVATAITALGERIVPAIVRLGPAEIDLLCREQRVAVEIDGYFHFLDATGYRRDRAKDWELQRRGYLILRFLAADVIPQLAVIRDRILEALAPTSPGGLP